jgi:hypothetical protein
MKYLKWNNLLSSYFFNPKNAGKDIFLYLTKNDIINLAMGFFDQKSPQEIWDDFLSSIRGGIPCSTGNIIEKAKFAYSKNDYVNRPEMTIEGVPIDYPPFISYLIFLVLPLIEDINDNDLRANNYYDRLNRFLKENDINESVGTNDFRDNQINCLWNDLSKWANINNNGELGFFNVIPFKNQHWVYVGKIFSQCMLPPKLINNLFRLFDIMGLVPNTIYDDDILKQKIKESKYNLLPKNTLNILNKDDELSKSIIQVIQKQYKKWTGETHDDIEEEYFKKTNTIVRLFLQLKINTNDEEIGFSYRMYYQNDYPDDLIFAPYNVLYEANGWSKTLHFQFKEALELEDKFNKWIAKFPDRNVRVFMSAVNFQLSNDFWIETDRLSKTDAMYLLCKNEKLESIKEWGKTFSKGNFKQINLEGLPENHSFFWFRNPTQSHIDISILRLYTEKEIKLVNGLKVNFRTYINDFLPEIEIVNSGGNENVYIQHKECDEKIYLSKHISLNSCWLLPKNTEINTDFYIKIEGENPSGHELAYRLASSENSANKITETLLPKRDSFGKIITNDSLGKIITNDSEPYCLGNHVINPNLARQIPYECLFQSPNEDIVTQTPIATTSFNNHSGNKLCSFLSLKKTLSTEDFFKAFEFYYLKEFSVSEQMNFTRFKKFALNFYNAIGIVDYEYETKVIVVNPPQLIFIPSAKGRTVLLIGARDTKLVESILNLAPKYNLQVEITKQFTSNKKLLLPDVLTIKTFGEKNLKSFAEELNIKLTTDYYFQVALKHFSSDLTNYEKSIQTTDENDYDWARSMFDPETLRFEKNEMLDFDKSFALLEYKLNEYTYHYKLWRNNECFKIDKNWGKFVVLKHFKKEVILFDDKNGNVAIPIETPLPYLLSKAIILLSGLIPELREIEGRKYRIYENVPSIIAQNFFSKLIGQKPIRKIL